MPIFRSHNTTLKRKTKERLQRIHQYFLDNPGCTINEAVAFIPETQGMVERYSKDRDKFNTRRSK